MFYWFDVKTKISDVAGIPGLTSQCERDGVRPSATSEVPFPFHRHHSLPSGDHRQQISMRGKRLHRPPSRPNDCVCKTSRPPTETSQKSSNLRVL